MMKSGKTIDFFQNVCYNTYSKIVFGAVAKSDSPFTIRIEF